ncbi:MAG: hypothetical protein JJE13_10755 [Thermoleophilia bacterium]|nr:hypothetical protein [Thermoleophilia bacterium]
MNSLLTKRLPGILALGLVTLAVGAAGSPASANTSGGAQISGLTPAQQKAKKRALRKCNRKPTARKRRACKRAVNKKYRKIANAVPPGDTTTVDLGDDFFAPAAVDLKLYDSINWSWANIDGFEPHNVTLQDGPTGVNRTDFQSSTTAEKSTRFKRQFVKPGTYNFVCSIHFQMTMTVNVSN